MTKSKNKHFRDLWYAVLFPQETEEEGRALDALTQKFANDPISFLSKRPLEVGRYTPGMKVMETVTMGGDTFTRERNHNPMMSVFGSVYMSSGASMFSARVDKYHHQCFLKLIPVGGVEGGLCQTEIYLPSEVMSGQESEFLKIWFLPWQPGHVMHVSLDDTGPDIFLTSSVTGCSVFVEGSPDHPTVYHANESATKFGGDQDAVIDYIEQMYYQNAKLPTTMGSVDRRHYYRETGAELSGLPLQYRHYFEEKHGGDVSVQTEAGMGTIFGVRKHGMWAFYLQERGLITFVRAIRQKKLLGKGAVAGYDTQIVTRHKALNIRQFWPRGVSHVKMTRFLRSIA